MDDSNMFHTEEVNIVKYVELNFTILKLLGLWIPTSYRGTRKALFYWIYSAFCCVTMVLSPILSEVVYEYMVLGDIEKMIANLYIALSHLGWMLKVFIVFRFRTNIQKLFETLQEPMFCRVDVSMTESVIDTMRKNLYANLTFLSLTVVTISSWAVFPFLDPNGLHLPIPTYYPVEQNEHHWFPILFVYQIGSICYLAFSNISYVTLVSGAISGACGQLDALCDKLADNHRHSGRRRRASLCEGVANSNHDELDDKEFSCDIETEKELIGCIEHHTRIIEYVKETEKLFGPIAFMQFFTSCGVVCCTLFQLTIVETAGEFFAMLTYMGCMLLELMIFCYFGNELIIKSQNVIEAAYKSIWYEMSLNNRRLVFIMMERAKRPLQVTAVIFTLSLSTFTSVLRSSYSYFAVLRRVNNR